MRRLPPATEASTLPERNTRDSSVSMEAQAGAFAPWCREEVPKARPWRARFIADSVEGYIAVADQARGVFTQPKKSRRSPHTRGVWAAPAYSITGLPAAGAGYPLLSHPGILLGTI